MVQYILEIIFLLRKQVSNASGVEVGAVTWLWNGCAKQAFTDSDSFRVSFPADANVAHRALLLAATMLLVSSNFLFINEHGGLTRCLKVLLILFCWLMPLMVDDSIYIYFKSPNQTFVVGYKHLIKVRKATQPLGISNDKHSSFLQNI